MDSMRLDKFLKVSRLVKRRTIANELCSSGRVQVNGRTAKPGTAVKEGDRIVIGFGSGQTRIRIKGIRPTVRKDEAIELYEILSKDETSANNEL